MWPLNMLAASLKPNQTFLAKDEINSINTRRGSKPNGQPEGTNKEKNLNPCFCNPSIVAPKTTVKLMKNVKIKWDVKTKL